jgi:hypothetical protein
VSLPRGVGSVRSVGRFPQRGGGARFERIDDGVRAGERFGRAQGGFARRPPTGLGEMIVALGSRGTTDHVFPLVVLVLLPWDMGSLVARE